MAESVVSPTSWRDRKREEIRSGLTRAARRMTVTEGFAGWTVEEVCAQVGVSRRTFFNYFPSKAAAVIGYAADDVPDQAVERFVASEGPLLAALTDLIEGLVTQIALTPAQLQEMQRAVAADPAVLELARQSVVTRDARLAALVARRQGLPADDPRALEAVRTFRLLMSQAMERYFAHGNTATFGELVLQIAESADYLFHA